jgi:tetratricopeptide (TPR) repeat protein
MKNVQSQNYSIAELLETAVSCQQNGEFAKAEELYRRIIKLNPKNADALHLLGLLMHQKGENKYALKYMKKSLKYLSRNPACLNNIGLVYKSLGKLREAKLVFIKAIAQDKNLTDAHNNLGGIYHEEGLILDAETAYKNALKINPDYCNAYRNLGILNELQGANEKAKFYYEKVLELNSSDAYCYNQLGNFLKEKGNFEKAISHYKTALELDDTYVDAYCGLAALKRYSEKDEDFFRQLNFSVARDIFKPNEKIRLHFALGKVNDDCGLYDEAFKHYKIGNTLRRELIDYNYDAHESNISRLIEFFDHFPFEKFMKYGSNSHKPVFIIGMPRSGTSLLEQIITSHTDVFGAGELDFFTLRASNLTQQLNSSSSYPDCLADLKADTIAKISDEYMSVINRISKNTLHVTDKTVSYFLHIGLMKIVFPKASFIHCKRHPIDTSLSIYFQNFAGNIPYAYDLEEIARYYSLYERIMSKWKELFADSILEINYEDIVNKQKETTQKLLSTIGLNWDEHCLSFHKTKRIVQTASEWQVRQPIYKRSMERWLKYEKYLTPLKKILIEK